MRLFTLFCSLILVLCNALLSRATPKGSTFTSPERLYTDKDGNVVREDNPARAYLLVAAGGEIAEAEARKYGLIDAEGNAVDLFGTTTDEAAPAPDDPNDDPPKKPATKRGAGPSEDK